MSIFEKTAEGLTDAVEGMAGTMEGGMEEGEKMVEGGMKEGEKMMKSGMKEGKEMMESGMEKGEKMMGKGKMMMYGGKRHMKSKTHKKDVGSRAEVFHGTAMRTSGGLTKKNLKKNKYGRIVSRKASKSAKKNFAKNLPKSVRAKPFKKGQKTRRRSRK